MLKSLLIPHTISVKYEYFLGLSISEDHLRVEAVDLEEEGAGNDAWVQLLEVLDVDIVPDDLSEESYFMEDDLLSMGEKFGVEGEVFDSGPLPGKGNGGCEPR